MLGFQRKFFNYHYNKDLDNLSKKFGAFHDPTNLILTFYVYVDVYILIEAVIDDIIFIVDNDIMITVLCRYNNCTTV